MPGYSKESLRDGIERAKKNIITFTEAIEKERETIVEFEKLIAHIEAKEATNDDQDGRDN